MGRWIELTWNCSQCGTVNRGRDKRCQCGSPREKSEMNMNGLSSSDYSGGRNKAATVTNPELLKLATAGCDWFCEYCDSGNIGTGNRCNSCGKYRENVNKIPTVPRSDSNKKLTRTAPKRTYSPEVQVEDSDPIADWKRQQKDQSMYLMVGGAGLFFALLVFTIWAMNTHTVGGTVTSLNWTQTVETMQWRDVTVRLWKHQTVERPEVKPVNGTGERPGFILLGNCRSEHYDDRRYVCGSHRECHPKTKTESYACGETCESSGNGFAHCHTKYCSRTVPDGESCRSVDDYCTERIYKDRCDYRTQEWQPLHSYPKHGVTIETSWANPELGSLDKEYFTADYQVYVTYDTKSYNFNPANNNGFFGKASMSKLQALSAESEFKKWDLGTPVTLTVNNLGGVRQVKIATPEEQ